MKKALSGLDLLAVEKELQTVVGSRIDKIYQPKRDEIEISISGQKGTRSRLHIVLTGWIWLGDATGDMPASPSSFASQLRKHISNARIAGVSQHGCDRIIELSLHKESDNITLTFELFSDGNVILSTNGEIVALLRRKKVKHRELKPKIAYRYPPAAFDPRSADREEFRRILDASNADIVRTLATKANLGGDYAEEVCSRVGMPKDAPASGMGASLIDGLWKEMGGLIRRLEKEPSPRISYENGKPVSVHPIELSSDTSREIKRFSSFSEAIDEYIDQLPREERIDDKESGERGRLERTLASQREALGRLKVEIEAAQKVALFLFTNFEQVGRILSDVKDGVEKGKLPDNVEIMDRGKGKFRISVDGADMVLCWKRNVTENAQELYEGVKKMRGKLEGTDVAIRKTLEMIESAQKESRVRSEKQHAAAKKSGEWYERYRWFFSSEGALVIAGKDAKSNDQLVKKHLQPGDRYVHADIHGAPSVVVKKKDGMTEASLLEAAVFSLCMSKAWNAGIGSGSAFWVTPEQVSKTPESGEFIAKGAWIVRGKRNYFERLELKLAVGICDLGKGRKAMCAPVKAVTGNCGTYIEITPGDIPKEVAARELSKRLSVDIEEIRPILPPGNMALIAEKKT